MHVQTQTYHDLCDEVLGYRSGTGGGPINTAVDSNQVERQIRADVRLRTAAVGAVVVAVPVAVTGRIRFPELEDSDEEMEMEMEMSERESDEEPEDTELGRFLFQEVYHEILESFMEVEVEEEEEEQEVEVEMEMEADDRSATELFRDAYEVFARWDEMIHRTEDFYDDDDDESESIF